MYVHCFSQMVSFVHAWSLFVGSDPGFNKFRIAYPHVPKQRNKYRPCFYLHYFLHLLISVCMLFKFSFLGRIVFSV